MHGVCVVFTVPIKSIYRKGSATLNKLAYVNKEMVVFVKKKKDPLVQIGRLRGNIGGGMLM